MPADFAAGITIAEVLKTPGLPSLEIRILLSHALGLSRVQLITQAERALASEEAARVSTLLKRRSDGEPIAYIVGEREFFGLTFHVTPDVLIPRPETELLVELALDGLPDGGRLLDLGTGSGAIAVAIAHTRPDADVMATDISDAALAVARLNAARHGVELTFLQSDWYRSLSARNFELIVANPPYIMKSDSHLSQGDLRFEPVGALTDHADGLSAIREIIDGADTFLVAGGWLMIEHGYDQASAVRALLQRHGFDEVQSWKDLAGIDRVSGGRGMRGHSATP